MPEMEVRLALLEKDHMSFREVVEELRDSNKSISESLKTLATLEAHHLETREGLGRAFAAIADHDKRLREIETVMPGLRETRSWVVAGVIGICSLVGISLVGLVLVGKAIPTHQAPVTHQAGPR